MNPAVWAVRACCIAGIWFAYRHALADGRLRQGSVEGLRAAIEARPNHYLFHYLLGRTGETEHLRRATELNPYHSYTKVDLALALEQQGKFDEADQMLREAARVDRTYYPLWSMANFHLRRGREDDFWKSTRRALEIADQDVNAMIGLCFRVEPDPAIVYQRAIPPRSWPLRSFLEATRVRRKPTHVEAAVALASFRAQADLDALYAAISALVADGRGQDAQAIWDAMARNGTAPATLSSLDRKFAPIALDWRVVSHHSVYATQAAGALDMTLDGKQEEGLELLQRWFSVTPGTAYQVRWKHRADSASAVRGILWRISTRDGAALPATGTLQQGNRTTTFQFTAPAAESVVKLALITIRPEGQTRATGTFSISSVDVEPAKR